MPRLDAITIKGFKSIRALENFSLAAAEYPDRR